MARVARVAALHWTRMGDSIYFSSSPRTLPLVPLWDYSQLYIGCNKHPVGSFPSFRFGRDFFSE